MSGLWSWFGGASVQKRKESPRSAILALRSQLEMLLKRADHLQNQIEKETDKAKEYVTTNKSMAKQALLRRKNHETTLEHTNSQIATLEQQINAIESANINMETLAAMQKAAKALESIHHNLTPEKVDETMDKLRDQNDLSNEVMNAITSNPLGQEIDDDDLNAELDELQQQKLDEQILKTSDVPVSDAVHRMPTAATREPAAPRRIAVAEDDEEEELRRLQAEMAM